MKGGAAKEGLYYSIGVNITGIFRFLKVGSTQWAMRHLAFS